MTLIAPGLATQLDAQQSFRAILTALSRPGAPVELTQPVTPPAPLGAAAAAVLLTLTDPTTGVALPDEPGLPDWLAFHTGARLAPPSAAEFILARELPALAALPAGSDDEPEAGATLILDLPSLNAGPVFQLTGPGIETSLLVQLPFSPAFAAERAAMYQRNPRGIDILLCAGRAILGLPRSTRIEEAR